MAKNKAKNSNHIPQKHVYSRVSFLYQAAGYLSSIESRKHDTLPTNPSDLEDQVAADKPLTQPRGVGGRQSRLLINHLKGVLLKSTTRVKPEVKHRLCKRCDTILLPGTTATIKIENKSKHGRKHWADTLVITCKTCGTIKRFPLSKKPGLVINLPSSVVEKRDSQEKDKSDADKDQVSAHIERYSAG